MTQEPFSLPYGCTWHGDTLEHGCVSNGRIKVRMKILSDVPGSLRMMSGTVSQMSWTGSTRHSAPYSTILDRSS